MLKEPPVVSIGGTTENIIQLHNERKGSSNAANGLQVGEARATYSLTDDTYKDATSSFDLYLYDIQTFTILKCSAFTTSESVVKGFKIRGLSSGAEGFAKNGDGTGVSEIGISNNRKIYCWRAISN